MNTRNPLRAAEDEFHAAQEALAVLQEAVPAFRELIRAFRKPMCRFLAIDAATSSGSLAELAETLSVHAVRMSELRQVISSSIAIAMASIERYRTHLHAADDGRGQFNELQGLADNTAKGMAGIERMVAEAERLLEDEAQRIQELALRFDVPAGVLELTRQLIDRAKD